MQNDPTRDRELASARDDLQTIGRLGDVRHTWESISRHPGEIPCAQDENQVSRPRWRGCCSPPTTGSPVSPGRSVAGLELPGPVSPRVVAR